MIARRLRTLAATGMVVALAAGCGLQSSSGAVLPAEPAKIEPQEGLEDAEITVVAKNFTEQLILGNMVSIALSTAGADVTNLSNTPGSFGARAALVEGDADVSPEYTGTGWINYLGNDEPIPGEEEQWRAVKEADAANGLVWLPPAPANNTYAFAIREEKAEELGVTAFSQLASLPPEELTFCVEPEFANRNDGFEPMLAAYDLTPGQLAEVLTLDTGVVYTATADGRCNFGEVFTTDGRIPGLNLRVLEDDRQFFPLYNLSMVVRDEVLEQYPEIEDVLGQITPLLTNEVLQDLNARVDSEGQDPAIVARDWLVEEGLVAMP
ncbi:glycine betaine ABC transporter substrate-binding protein [Aeromicrobium camelliae]|nr:glycine betaine ABC transporter substrate-binding protein [Aeromicrobium camelliae]